ncbi:MAG: hypothetical protein SH850_29825 [Planctomycetaceae bacterium]|nr:hypothetical protein [Planctomycetaceae bacterium]
MSRPSVTQTLIHAAVTAALLGLTPAVVLAQKPLTAPKYSEVRLAAVATGEELAAQPDLWVMDVYFKPMRQVAIELTDPKTGQKRTKYVWYVVYRAVNRPLPKIVQDNPPVNELDPPVLPPKFVPAFTLMTTDTPEPKLYEDKVLPEALAVIARRERLPLRNSVSAVGTVPPPTEPGSPDQQVIYGVATFTDVDPEADRYTVFMTGFSNGVRKVPGPDGSTGVQNKTIITKYWRPGDQFDQREPEIRLDGDPQWIYR